MAAERITDIEIYISFFFPGRCKNVFSIHMYTAKFLQSSIMYRLCFYKDIMA